MPSLKCHLCSFNCDVHSLTGIFIPASSWNETNKNDLLENKKRKLFLDLLKNSNLPLFSFKEGILQFRHAAHKNTYSRRRNEADYFQTFPLDGWSERCVFCSRALGGGVHQTRHQRVASGLFFISCIYICTLYYTPWPCECAHLHK